MIVISGALVLVALVLLVIGLVGPSLAFVYASIGASVAAFAFLVVGVLQRRKEEAVVDGAPSSAADIAAAIRTPEAHLGADPVGAASSLGGEVLVVEGRPRYHVAGCRYLTGKDARGVDVGEAKADGFTACGVCKPDEALAAAPAQPVVADDAHVAIVEPVTQAAAPAAVTLDKVPAKRAAAKAATPTATKAPARAAAKAPAKAATKAPARAAAKAPAKVAAKAVTKAPAKAAVKAPAKAAAKAAPAKAAAAPAKKAAAPAKKVAAVAKKAAPAKKAAAKKAPAKRG